MRASSTARRTRSLVVKLKSAQAHLGRNRDVLRAIQDEAGDLLDTVERADEALSEAIQALSELA